MNLNASRTMHETEDRLRQTVERLARAQQFAGAGVWDWDIRTGRIDWSPELFHLFGLDSAEAEAGFESWRQVLHPDDRAAAEERISAAVRDRVHLRSEYRVILPSGQVRWINALGNTWYDGEGAPVKMAGICLDITERKQAERLLRELQEEQQLILDSVPAMIWYKDTENRILRINATAARSLGLPKEQIEGKPTEQFYPEEADRYFRDDLAVIQTGQPRLGIEEPYRLPSGEIRWVQTDKIPLKDESGRVTRLLVMALDITERKRLQDEAQRYIEQLQESDRRKNDFLAMLAHELRNPLAPLRNAVEIMRRSSLNQGLVTWCRDMIDRQVTYLTRMVDDLLDVARISQSRIELRKEPVDLADIVQQAIEVSGPLIEARRHQFSVQLPSEPVRVDADPVRLTQVVTNLLTNAANYSDEGGNITLIVEPHDDVALIRVRDGGCGIDPADLSSVFDVFYQAKPTLDRARGGLGIGLSVVRSLVAMHGGDVQAFSDGPGRGSEFVVTLPRLPNEQASMPHPPTEAVLDPGGRHILVVDDNRDAAQSLAFLLRNFGHQVSVAYDGVTALEVARAEQPEIIVLDIGLPGMDGYAVARALRQRPDQASLRLIAVTGYGEESAREKAIHAGFDAYLTKPVKLPDLLMSLGLTP